MPNESWLTSHTAAYATPDLVGRVEILAQIQAAFAPGDEGAKLIFLSGEGGVGKTRLLKETLRIAENIPGAQVAREIIDFYHIHTHTSTGLAHSMFLTLTPPTKHFEEYEDAYKKLKHLSLSGETGIDRQRENATDAFIAGLKKLGKTNRIVVALDTSERLVYGTKDAPKELTQIAEGWQWLCNHLNELDNLVVLMAGRPEESKPLFENLPVQVSKIPIGPFSPGESVSYFDAVEKIAQENNAYEIARRVAFLTLDERHLAHSYSGGRPILLALLVDYLSTGGQLSPLFADNKDNRNEFESTVIARIMETRELGDIIRIVGRVRKGISQELLAHILGERNKKDFRNYLDEAADYIERLQKFSFVKIRPSDQRLFLHDEAYALLDRHVYNRPEDETDKELVYTAINHYYETQFDNNRKEVDALFEPIEKEGKALVDETRFTEATSERKTLFTEYLYYQLRQNAVKGYRRYYRYTRDATLSDDSLLDIQLQLEMLAFVAEKKTDQNSTEIDGLDLSFVNWAMALSPVRRAFAAHEYDKVLEESQRVRTDFQTLINQDVFKRAGLDTWDAYGHIYKGNAKHLQLAADLLNKALERMEKAYHPEQMDDNSIWRAQAVLAFAYRVRGYLNRIRNEINQAIDDYQQAARWLKTVDIKVELATLHNDLGFAMAEKGDWADARALVLQGLSIRRELVERVPIAYSLNTLATIDTREGYHQNAITEAESALGLFRALGSNRGTGMALTALAEAQRRYARSADVGSVDGKISLLRESRDNVQNALTYLANSEVARQVEAYIVLGCSCRDWVYVRKNRPNSKDDIQRLILQSKNAFDQAIELAGESLIYKKIDALVNMAWLSYYAGDNEAIVLEVCKRAENVILSSYKNPRGTGSLNRLPMEGLIWTQLGKVNVLRGNLAFDKSTQEIREKNNISAGVLKDIADYYFWGLQYNANYNSDYQGIRQAKDNIYPRLREFAAGDLKMICDEILVLEKGNNLAGKSEIGKMLKARVLWQE